MEKARYSRVNTEALMGPGSLTLRKKTAFRGRSLRNLFRMGHCAPAVMKTILDICGSGEEWPVKAAAGLPGGIGDTGFECGGITSPLLFLGLRHGLRDPQKGLPLVFFKGHSYFQKFVDRNGTPLCSEIRGDNFRLTHCIKAVCTSPETIASVSSNDDAGAIAGEQLDAFALLYSHMEANSFHCLHEVLQHLSPAIPMSQELLDATSGYLGGTLFKGMTCSAYAAGVMALGLRMAEIEDSLPRVMRMIVLMKTGRDAFAEHLNKFNRIMNLGSSLGLWFKKEFGDTQCRVITKCNFSSLEAVGRYVEADGLAQCRHIARKVADKVLSLMSSAQPA